VLSAVDRGMSAVHLEHHDAQFALQRVDALTV